MRNILVVLLLCLGFTGATAQEVYTSSGKPGYMKKAKKHKGYDPDKLIIGGGLNLGLGSGYANVGVAPIVGYRITDQFSAGIGLGYQYNRAPILEDPVTNQVYYAYQHMIYPSIWTRYFVYKNFFVEATYEYDFINRRYPLDNYGMYNETKSNVTNSCLLVGIGVKQPIAGRVYLYGALVYDVLQGAYSPYPKNSPDVRFGIIAGL
jgi:hypothetical protein